jgi:Zn ribbon nucleic-acid-binding protein
VATITEIANCPKCGEVNTLTLYIQTTEYVLGGPGERTLPDPVVCPKCSESLKIWVKEVSDAVKEGWRVTVNGTLQVFDHPAEVVLPWKEIRVEE